MGEGGFGEGEFEAGFFCEGEGDAGIFGGVGGGEVALVLAGLHVGAIGFEDAGIGAGLGEDFAEHGEIEAEGVAEAEAFGEAGGVDVHHHIDEGFDLRGAAGGADVTASAAEGLENGRGMADGGGIAGEDEIEGALARLGDAGGHAGLDGGGAGAMGGSLDLEVHVRGDGGEIDEGAAGGANEEIIARGGEDIAHGLIVRDDGEDEIGGGGDFGEG